MCTYSLFLCVMPYAEAADGVKPLVWPESEVGFASNHWFGPNRGRVLLQTIGLARIGVGFCFKPPGLAPIGGRFGIKPPGLAQIGGRFCIKPPGLALIGGRFCFKPLVWLKSEVCFASNHWLDPNRGRVLLQTIGLARIGGRFGIKPPGLTPSTPRKALVFSVRYSFRAGVRQGSPCRWRRRRR